MPVTLSIKQVPDAMANALRRRARANRRSLQGELMAILDESLGAKPFDAKALLRHVRQLGVSTPSDSVAIVRELRNTR